MSTLLDAAREYLAATEDAFTAGGSWRAGDPRRPEAARDALRAAIAEAEAAEKVRGPDEEWLLYIEDWLVHIIESDGSRHAAHAIAARLRAREEAVQRLCEVVERRDRLGTRVEWPEIREALAAVRKAKP